MARPCKHIAEALPPMPRVIYFLGALAVTLAAGIGAAFPTRLYAPPARKGSEGK